MEKSSSSNPTPLFSYPAGEAGVVNLHSSARLIKHEGRNGLTFRSIRGRAALPRHTVGGRRGSLAFWVLPLQEFASAAHHSAQGKSNPYFDRFVFLTDREAVQDIDAANFCLLFSTDWYPVLIGKFMSGSSGGGGDAGFLRPLAVMTANHFEMMRLHWYHLAATWDRDKGSYHLYANGILVATSDTTATDKPFEEEPSQTLYFGSPGYAMGDVEFFDAILSPSEIRDLFREGGGAVDSEIQRTLEKRHEGRDLPRFDPPNAEGWVRRKTLSLQSPEQDTEFFHQGCGPCLHYSQEGLRITTPPMEDFARKQGAKNDMTRMYLWTRDVFEGDLHVTAEFKIHKHGGLALWMFQAAGMQGEDFLADYPLRSDGAMSMVCWEDVRNYHWEFYREMIDTRNDLVSHALIKNPWFCPLAFQMENRRWELDRWYRVTFVQEKNRLRGAIDDVMVFDVSDSGTTNNGPVLRQGHVALRVMMRSDVTFRNLEISNRPDFT